MTIVYKPHVCQIPPADVTGEIWRCDECGQYWRAGPYVREVLDGRNKWHYEPRWYRLGRFLRWWHREAIAGADVREKK